MKLTQRIQAISVTHPLSMNRKIDQYLSERLPDMMDEYKIADRSDLSDLEKKMGDLENRMDELDNWRSTYSERLGKDESRMARLKVKYGVK